MNFIQYPPGFPEESTDAQRTILDAVSHYSGVVMGGPDILPENEALRLRVYPRYPEYKDKMDLFCSAQYDSFSHLHVTNAYPYTTKYWTPEEIFTWAEMNLHIKYMFWNYKTWHSPSDDYIFEDAKPVIENNPVFNIAPEVSRGRGNSTQRLWGHHEELRIFIPDIYPALPDGMRFKDDIPESVRGMDCAAFAQIRGVK
jgi:hypothetical protein